MYGDVGNEFSYNNFPLPDMMTPSVLPRLTIPSKSYDSLSVFKSDSCYIGSPTSITSTYGTHSPTSIQRSISTHSLQKNSPLYSSHSPVRKALSTGDLQCINLAQQHNQRFNSPLSNESSIIIESMNKACRYSPQEKRERLERYRSKRNLRNFSKRIKYECRKTVADSRPRVRGRFVRNDETEKTAQSHRDHVAGIEENDDDYWINIINACF